MKATVEMLNGERRRLSLPSPVWEGTSNFGLGTTLTALYILGEEHIE